jgi:hypothetical protein
MKRSTIWLAMTAILLLVAATAMAKNGKGPNQPNGGTGMGCLACASLDLRAVETVTGPAVSFEGGPGVGMPTLVLAPGGQDLEVTVGPYRLWIDSGIEVTPGESLTVTYAPCARTGHFVALSVTENETGKTVQLRDPETGQPLGLAGRGRRG